MITKRMSAEAAKEQAAAMVDKIAKDYELGRPREIPVQNNAGNEHSNNLIIANITSQLKRVKVPTYVVLQWYGGFILIEAILIKEYTYI